MLMNKNKLMRKLETAVSIVMGLLPSLFSKPLVALGLPRCIKQSRKINFVSMLYDTSFRFNVRGDYAIEQNASSRFISPTDPYQGLKQICLSDFTAIDIGANVGTISLALAALGARQIIAIEPGPLFNRLVKNISLNNLMEIIKPLQIGLGKIDGTLYWAEDKNNLGNAHLISSLNQLSFEIISTRFQETNSLK